MRSSGVGPRQRPDNPNCLCEYRETEQLTLAQIGSPRFWLCRIGPLPSKRRPSIRWQNDLHGLLPVGDRQTRTNHRNRDSSVDDTVPSPSSRNLLMRRQSTCGVDLHRPAAESSPPSNSLRDPPTFFPSDSARAWADWFRFSLPSAQPLVG